jgi:hypothetical protein
VSGQYPKFSAPHIAARFRWEPREAYRALTQSARRGLPLWPLYLSFLVLAAINAGPVLVRQWERGGWAAVDARFLAWTLAPVLLLALMVPVTALWVAYGGPRPGDSDDEQLVAVGPDGVRASTRLFAGELRWSAVTKAVETPDFFLFFRSRMQAIYVPKRALGGGDADVLVLRELLRAQLGARAELRRD